MKLCPKCKATLDDDARFCLRCMTSLEEKEQIPPPVSKNRRWPLVLVLFLFFGLLSAFFYWYLAVPEKTPNIPVVTEQPSSVTEQPSSVTEQPSSVTEQPSSVTEQPSSETEDPTRLTQIVDGVTYTYRPATREDYPTAISLDNYYVLIRVEGTPPDGIYRIPSFVGDDMTALVTVIADDAFAGTDARCIDLGFNIRYVWDNAFSGYALTDLYLHTDVYISQPALSGCSGSLTIHGPEHIENTEGLLWSVLAADYGFRWQAEAL